MTDLPDLLTLPLDTIAVLAAGYLGYRLAYAGKDARHAGIDTLFMSLVYALVAKLALHGLTLLAIPHLIAIPVAVAAALLVAAVWRKWGERVVFRSLRGMGISTSDRSTTAWENLRVKPGFAPTTYLVQKADGTLLMCQTPENFAHLRDGPCILGSDGSIALFVTHRRLPGCLDWEGRDVFDPVLGYAMTYVPASQIVEIRVDLLT